MTRTFAVRLVIALVLLVGGALVYAVRHGEIAAIAKPDPKSFDRALVERGQKLAGIGNCHVCHTRNGGRPYAGGRPLPTPFGVIHSTNITPDPDTGIGRWPLQAFVRAMREGVDRQGKHLYPAFPYDYYTKTTDEDLKAIYAYLMTREAVVQKAADNGLVFPFNLRLLLAGWNVMFHESGVFRPDPARDAEWNRGAYLVQGLGHCGACHSPRNVFGAAVKRGDKALSGGHAEDWWAPPLTKDSPGPVGWSGKALVNYLIDGWDGQHGIAAGPMTPIVDDLKDQHENEAFAIAAYLMSLKGGRGIQAENDVQTVEALKFATKTEWGNPDAPKVPDDPLLQRGAKIFESQCGSCHKAGGKPVPLALTSTVNAPHAGNFVRITLFGVQPPRGVLDRSMPGRGSQISDDEMVALVAFVRSRFSRKPAWEGVGEIVRKARAAGH